MHESEKRTLLFDLYRSIGCRNFAVIVFILDFCRRRTIFRIECLGHFLWQRATQCNLRQTVVIAICLPTLWSSQCGSTNVCAANAFNSDELHLPISKWFKYDFIWNSSFRLNTKYLFSLFNNKNNNPHVSMSSSMQKNCFYKWKEALTKIIIIFCADFEFS